MGIFSKLKNNLFKDDEDKLVHEKNEKSLSNLNMEPQIEKEEKEPEILTIKEQIEEEKERVFNPNFSTSVINQKEYTPQSFEETEEIANQIIKGNKVIVDTSLLPVEDIVRMLDFLSGMMFALKGEIIRNSKFIFTFHVK